MQLDLSDQEYQTLEEYCNHLGYQKCDEAFFQKFRPEKLEQVTNFVLEFQGMTEQMQRWTAEQVFGDGDEGIATEEDPTSQETKASIIRLIEGSAEEWSLIPEKTRDAAIQKLEGMKNESAVKKDAAILKKMPKELQTIVNLSPEQWQELPEGAHEAILHKMCSLEEKVKKGILTSTKEDPESDEDGKALRKLARECVMGDNESCAKFRKIMEGK